MRTTKIGLLVAIALAILMVTVFSLNQEQPFWERKVQYELRFTRTGGLQTGAPVSLSGVSIGTVANVQATTASLEKILQRVDRGEGMLGQLTSDTKEARELLGHVRRSARSLDQLTTRLNRGNGALARLMEDETYAQRVLGNLDRAIRDLADVAAKLDRGQGTLGKPANDPARYHDAKALVGGARKSWFLRFFGGVGPPPPDTPPPTDRPGG